MKKKTQEVEGQKENVERSETMESSVRHTNEIVTSDFSRFWSREREMAEELLKAWREQGLPKDFEDDEVTICMNTNSGNVFLTNDNYQVAMMNGDVLESFYSCPECGHEGFLDEMKHKGGQDCRRFLKEIKNANGGK